MTVIEPQARLTSRLWFPFCRRRVFANKRVFVRKMNRIEGIQMTISNQS